VPGCVPSLFSARNRMLAFCVAVLVLVTQTRVR